MADLFAGTWDLDLSRCRYESRQPPRSATYTIVEDGVGYLVFMEWLEADGTRQTSSYGAIPDGVRRKHTDGGIDEVSMTRVSERRLDSASFRNGKSIHRSRRDLSEDGRALTITQIFRGADGETHTDWAVYTKR